mgnify:FL=1
MRADGLLLKSVRLRCWDRVPIRFRFRCGLRRRLWGRRCLRWWCGGCFCLRCSSRHRRRVSSVRPLLHQVGDLCWGVRSVWVWHLQRLSDNYAPRNTCDGVGAEAIPSCVALGLRPPATDAYAGGLYFFRMLDLAPVGPFESGTDCRSSEGASIKDGSGVSCVAPSGIGSATGFLGTGGGFGFFGRIPEAPPGKGTSEPPAGWSTPPVGVACSGTGGTTTGATGGGLTARLPCCAYC